MCALVWWTIHRSRAIHNSLQSSINLAFILTAINCYSAEHHSLPPPVVYDEDGCAMHSWRALILPYLDQDLAKRYRYDQPWNGPVNSLLADEMPIFYRNQNLGRYSRRFTTVFAVTGSDCWDLAPQKRFFGANCVSLFEAGDSEILWTQPLDVTSEECLSLIEGETIGTPIWAFRSRSTVVGPGQTTIDIAPNRMRKEILRNLFSIDPLVRQDAWKAYNPKVGRDLHTLRINSSDLEINYP